MEVGIEREEQGRRVNRGLDVLLACRSELSSKQAGMLNRDRLVRHGGPGLADRGSRTATGRPGVTDRECVWSCVYQLTCCYATPRAVKRQLFNTEGRKRHMSTTETSGRDHR